MRVSSLVLTVGAVVAAAAGIAGAQPAAPDPAALHKQGRARAKAGLDTGDRAALEEAVKLFKDALALGDSPPIECDLGVALHHLGEDARAHARLTRCMPRLAAASPAKVAAYRGVVAAVDAAVAKDHAALDVATSPPGAVISISTFPPDETVLAPTLLWLRAGSHEVTAHVDGHRDMTFTVEVSEAEAKDRVRKSWKVKLDRTPVDGGDGGGGGGGGASTSTEPVTEPDRRKPRDPAPGGNEELGAVGGLVGFGDAVGGDPPPPRRSRTAAYGTLAAGGALLVGGAVVHLLGRDERAHLATLSGPAYDAYLPTWQRYQRATIGLYAAGAIATGVGAWLYTRAATPASLAISPAPEGTGAMLWVIAR